MDIMRKIGVLVVAGAIGLGFARLGLPAGWLIGAMMVGMVYRLFAGDLSYPQNLYELGFAVIGVSVGLSIQLNIFSKAEQFLGPLALTIGLLLAGSWIMSLVLHRFSLLDAKTALFCCIPGGASIMMALSDDYGADARMVTAFQSARVILFVTAIPIFAGLVSGDGASVAGGKSPSATGVIVHTASGAGHGIEATGTSHLHGLLLMACLILLAIIGTKLKKIPASTFFYGMLLGFAVNTFIIPIGAMPSTAIGVGQVILGLIIGLRFDHEALKQIKAIGWMSLGLFVMYLLLVFGVSLLFYVLTGLDYSSSLLSVVPAGAPQMASTAALLHLNAPVVASMQLLRLIVIMVLLPFFIPLLMRMRKFSEGSDV